MDALSPEYLAELGRQLATIAAFLGGFSITFFGTLLTLKSTSRLVSWALGATAVAAGSFVVTVIAITTLVTSQHPNAPPSLTLSSNTPERAAMVTEWSLVLGTLGLLVSLAISGWIHSRGVGIVTTLTSVLSAVFIFWAFSGF